MKLRLQGKILLNPFPGKWLITGRASVLPEEKKEVQDALCTLSWTYGS